MPTYTFRHKETGEVTDVYMRMSELDQYKADNPHLEKIIVQAPGCVDPVTAGILKPSEGFRDLLKHMKKGNKGSNINDW